VEWRRDRGCPTGSGRNDAEGQARLIALVQGLQQLDYRQRIVARLPTETAREFRRPSPSSSVVCDLGHFFMLWETQPERAKEPIRTTAPAKNPLRLLKQDSE
jgi:hypothetical protein